MQNVLLETANGHPIEAQYFASAGNRLVVIASATGMSGDVI